MSIGNRVYDYDALGQVVSAEKRLSDDTTVLPGYAYGYSYDDIGNRVETVTNGRTADYTPNLLNQYTERDYPGALDARGVANAGFTVEVNGVAATRTGADYYGVGTFNNSSGAVLGELEIEITDPGPPPVPQPTEIFSLATTGRTDPYVIPETPEEFVYDLDGNLLTDGRWDYVWDGENRLVSMTIRAQVVTDTAMVRQRMLFDYDSSGRRIRTQTEEYVSSAWVPVSEVRYLYDGWNVVAELDGMGVTRSMTWGPDLSGTEQGAGGVGGLLWTVDDNSDGMVPGYDGNGNIIAWLDISDGSLAGTREYGAFGEDVTFTGVSHQIPFGFSTKYQDHLSGLYYYGYRYYNASMGRWLNRDPIDEQGGVNLYAFVGNNGVGLVDILGLLVTMTYDLHSDILTITDDDSGEFVTLCAKSGGAPFGDPIPVGRWEILEQAQRSGFWRLDAIDDKPRNDVHESTKRNELRLHGPGLTIGCIAARQDCKNCWDSVVDILNNTTTINVKVESRRRLQWLRGPAVETVKMYGVLTVTNSSKDDSETKQKCKCECPD